MLGLFPLKTRRKDLGRTLREDVTQPGGWESWLVNAKSIDELHATCSQPGWLTYGAYWAKVSHAATQMLVRMVPTQVNVLMSDLGLLWSDHRRRLADELRGKNGGDDDDDDEAEDDDEDLGDAVNQVLDDLDDYGVMPRAVGEADAKLLGPHRDDPTALAKDDAAPFLAAGYVFTIETVFHRARGLREALTWRSAAAASLLRMTAPTFQVEALALLRKTYGWT